MQASLLLMAVNGAGLPWSRTETWTPQHLASQSLLEIEVELSHNFRLILLHR